MSRLCHLSNWLTPAELRTVLIRLRQAEGFKATSGKFYDPMTIRGRTLDVVDGFDLEPGFMVTAEVVATDADFEFLWKLAQEHLKSETRTLYQFTLEGKLGIGVQGHLGMTGTRAAEDFYVGSEQLGRRLAQSGGKDYREFGKLTEWMLDSLGLREELKLHWVGDDYILEPFEAESGICFRRDSACGSATNGIPRVKGYEPDRGLDFLQRFWASVEKPSGTAAFVSKDNDFPQMRDLLNASGFGPWSIDITAKPKFNYDTVVDAVERGDGCLAGICTIKPSGGGKVEVVLDHPAGDGPSRLEFHFPYKNDKQERAVLDALTQILGYEPEHQMLEELEEEEGEEE